MDIYENRVVNGENKKVYSQTFLLRVSSLNKTLILNTLAISYYPPEVRVPIYTFLIVFTCIQMLST